MKKNYISFEKAYQTIQKGGVIAIPTETVYGLAGLALKESALKKIFQLKKRPLFNPLIIHCANQKQMRLFYKSSHPLLNKMIKHFTPGPLTFILDKTQAVHPLITATQKKVGLRIPHHPLTLKLLQHTGPLCAPSANLFGKLSSTQALHVHQIFKGKVPVLNGGACQKGMESTVIEPIFKTQVLKILRPGPISKKELQNWLKKETSKNWKVHYASSSLSPGQTKKHYQPNVPLVLIKTTGLSPSKKEIAQKLDPFFPGKTYKHLKLKATAPLTARTLYHQLNTLSQNPKHIIYIIKPLKKQNSDPWEVIWNRLNKACSKKITF